MRLLQCKVIENGENVQGKTKAEMILREYADRTVLDVVFLWEKGLLKTKTQYWHVCFKTVLNHPYTHCEETAFTEKMQKCIWRYT